MGPGRVRLDCPERLDPQKQTAARLPTLDRRLPDSRAGSRVVLRLSLRARRPRHCRQREALQRPRRPRQQGASLDRQLLNLPFRVLPGLSAGQFHGFQTLRESRPLLGRASADPPGTDHEADRRGRCVRDRGRQTQEREEERPERPSSPARVVRRNQRLATARLRRAERRLRLLEPLSCRTGALLRLGGSRGAAAGRLLVRPDGLLPGPPAPGSVRPVADSRFRQTNCQSAALGERVVRGGRTVVSGDDEGPRCSLRRRVPTDQRPSPGRQRFGLFGGPLDSRLAGGPRHSPLRRQRPARGACQRPFPGPDAPSDCQVPVRPRQGGRTAGPLREQRVVLCEPLARFRLLQRPRKGNDQDPAQRFANQHFRRSTSADGTTRNSRFGSTNGTA